jgi:hypothetical protein
VSYLIGSECVSDMIGTACVSDLIGTECVAKIVMRLRLTYLVLGMLLLTWLILSFVANLIST